MTDEVFTRKGSMYASIHIQFILRVLWNEFFCTFYRRSHPYVYHDLPGRNCFIPQLSAEM